MGVIDLKKRILSLMLLISMILGMSALAFAGDPSISLNNETITLEQESFIDENGVLMLPLRSLLEKMNYEVTWNGQDRSVNLSKDDQDILLKIDSKEVAINGETETIGNSPIIKESRSFIPAEMLDISLDSILSWNSKDSLLSLRDAREKMVASSKNNEKRIELDNYMKALVDYENFHGSVLLAKEGEILLNEGYGYADFAQNITNKSQTRYAIGSVTKQFAAFATLKLREEGLLNLEDKISKYIADFPYGDEISIHNLLTHTSGLANYTDLPDFMTVDTRNRDPQKMIDLVRDMELQFNPGEMFQYSNTNYLAIGMIIEEITGKSFEEYLESMVSPLEMEDTGLIDGELGGKNDASPYTGYLEVVEVDDDLVTSQAYAAGSIYSTVEDLYRWDRAVKSGELLGNESLESMFTSHIDMPGAGSYGYGWMINESDRGKEIFHGGNTFGFSAYLGRLIEPDITIIILSNSSAYNTTELKNNLTAIVMDQEYKLPEEIKEIEIEDKELYSKYIGKYDVANGLKMDIMEVEGRLYAQMTGQAAFEIFPSSNTEFFYKIVDAQIVFETDEDGLASGFTLYQLGYEFPAKRAQAEEEKVALELDPEIIEALLGDYDMGVLAKGVTISIIKEDGKLFAQITGQPKAEILAASEREFYYKDIDAEIIFETDGNGTVKSLTLHQMGQEIMAPKIK